MKEFVQVISDEDFKREMEFLKREICKRRKNGFSKYEILKFVTYWVTEPSASVRTPEQLGKIFDLAEDKNERPCETAISGHSKK